MKLSIQETEKPEGPLPLTITEMIFYKVNRMQSTETIQNKEISQAESCLNQLTSLSLLINASRDFFFGFCLVPLVVKEEKYLSEGSLNFSEMVTTFL
ncbi:hypothetical protein EUGRSUZ_L02247 [Eucalyptus grandis]|uniref:Uncharacterized protein n=1 Tax=Eucalyptus grandis TaxID=71139 RepID=A0A058ZTE7_EUCGR|nr:hypothetical protein EUGRSUZ_L02247 [Eucalyptus grandis]